MLSNREKANLINLLKISMEEKEDDGSRFYILYKAATDVVGSGILTSSRQFHPTLGRKFIVYKMRQEGYTLQAVGRHLAKHHASVYHLQRDMEHILEYPNVYKLEMAYWNEFNKKIAEYETNTRTDQGS